MAEGEGFEPSIRFPVYTLSRRAPSTTRPPLQCEPAVRILQHPGTVGRPETPHAVRSGPCSSKQEEKARPAVARSGAAAFSKPWKCLKVSPFIQIGAS
jgi:hypothetical protein